MFTSIYFFQFLPLIYGLQIIDLTESDWYLENTNLSIKDVPIDIPGSVHTCLYKYGYIDNPYKPFNDDQYAWIADEEWTIKGFFSVNAQQLQSKRVLLSFDTVDTISDVVVNNQEVGQTDNMFIQYSFDITRLLKPSNEIQIRFQAPTKYAEKQYHHYLQSFGYKVPPVALPDVQHGRNHQNFIRKEQCSFSWDWGPSFPTIGLNGKVQLEIIEFIKIDHILVHTIFHQEFNVWDLNIELIFNANILANATVLYGFDNFHEKVQVNITEGENQLVLKAIQVPSHSIQTWWPRGYGDQKLYTAHVKIIDVNSLEYGSSKVNFGFRTVKLNQDLVPGGKPGRQFYFEFNGRPIFLKGANWIPADAFQERVTYSVLEGLLNDTVEANMNALRVWGGGIYEQDQFYDLADRLGIVIWQDLMFAVALYPVDDQFLKSVENEIKYQVRRLQHHPSIITWSGNNENEAAIAQKWWKEVEIYKEQLENDYRKLYVETIKPIVEGIDWNRPFLVSSPSNGIESEKEGYISDKPQNELYGDVHFYNYTADCWDTSIFKKPRFASEYGYQSYPSYMTWRKIADDNHLIWNSTLMFNRQHHASGNKEIEDFIEQHFKLPTTPRQSTKYFKDMIYLSQIVQATCIKYESEHYRRWQGNYIENAGNTMGALYWQLNDIWQGPSWSSIEYGRRWKMLHYYVKSFFSAQAVSGYVSSNSLNVYVLLDRPELENLLTVKIQVYGWKKFDVLWEKMIDYNPIKESSLVYEADVNQICPSNTCFVMLHLIRSKSLAALSSSVVFIDSFNNFNLENPNLSIKNIDHISDKRFRIEIQANSPAAFVWLETSIDGHFSDNGFILSQPFNTVEFTSTYDIPLSALKENLSIQSLYDVYHN